jgi:hypothetical protein
MTNIPHISNNFFSESTYMELNKRQPNTLFLIGDEIRICNGIHISKLMRQRWNSFTVPDVSSDDSIGKFGKIMNIYDQQGNEIFQIKSTDNLTLSHSLLIKFIEKNGIPLKDENQTYLVDKNAVVNYSLLNEDEANILFEETKDRNINEILNLTQFRDVTVPIHLEDSVSSIEWERMEMKCNILRSFIINMYLDMMENLIRMNKEYRMETMCNHANPM